MNSTHAPERYATLTIALHWLMLLQIVAVYACIQLADLFPKGSDLRASLKSWHFTLGLTVLVLVFVRLTARLSRPRPLPLPETPAWQRRLAGATHVALYALMLCMPLLGWMALSAGAKPIPFFGLGLPALLQPDKALGHSLEEIHETLGEIGYYLIGLHAAAALFHHYVVGDATLRRMLPGRRAP